MTEQTAWHALGADEAIQRLKTSVTAGLDEAYKEYSDQIKEAGYATLFTEKEDHDAEISYKGEGRSGQIALRDPAFKPTVPIVNIPPPPPAKP